MAASSTNIAEELYAILVNNPYKEDVQVIEADTQPSPDELKKVKKVIDKDYQLNTGRFQTRRGNHLPNGMFELLVNTLDATHKLLEMSCMTGSKTKTTKYEQ